MRKQGGKNAPKKTISEITYTTFPHFTHQITDQWLIKHVFSQQYTYRVYLQNIENRDPER